MLRATNIRHSNICAFCQHWHDPAGAAIRPQNTVGGFWQYDDTAWNVCKLYGAKKRSGMGCNKYVGKFS